MASPGLKKTAVALGVGLWMASAAVAQQPPRNLHLVGDHWTAWNPPAPPAGADVYVIAAGDTLWDLAARFYGDPYLWPQIWERNRYIQDSHWIYPGDPLVLGMRPTTVEEVSDLLPAGEEVPPEPTAARQQRYGRFSGAPEPLGSESDIFCSGFIGGFEEEFPLGIVGSEYQNLAPSLGSDKTRVTGIYGQVDAVKFDLSGGDVVYLDGGESAGVLPGTEYSVVAPGARVVHPLSGEVMGRYYASRGRLRVLSVQAESAIAEINYSCAPINVGDRLRPFEREPVPLGRRTPMRGLNDPVSQESLADAPSIILSSAGLVSLGQDHVVHIDRGAGDQVTPGDVFTIYRMSSPGQPPVVVGELAVLTVTDHTAVAKILESRYSVHLGDRLSPKGR